MTACEWEPCADPATHSVEITFPGQPAETWHVCRPHDRQVKASAVRSRPALSPLAEAPTVAKVACGQCHRLVDEPPGLRSDDRRACPACGSLVRHVSLSISGTVEVRESLRARLKRAGKGGWVLDIRGGVEYTRDLAAWGKRQLTLDRETDLYREVIELFDGTRITSTARLTDHRD